jgi:hypothetical protein
LHEPRRTFVHLIFVEASRSAALQNYNSSRLDRLLLVRIYPINGTCISRPLPTLRTMRFRFKLYHKLRTCILSLKFSLDLRNPPQRTYFKTTIPNAKSSNFISSCLAGPTTKDVANLTTANLHWKPTLRNLRCRECTTNDLYYKTHPYFVTDEHPPQNQMSNWFEKRDRQTHYTQIF